MQYCELYTIQFHKTKIVEKTKALNFQNSVCSHSHHDHKSWVMTERVRSQVQASEMRFSRRIEGVHCLTRCVAMRFENPLKLSRYFSELKELCLDGLIM